MCMCSRVQSGLTMNNEYRKLSKTISYALRHHPEEFGLTLDSEGYAPISALLDALGQRVERWKSLQEGDIVEMMAQAEKQRFEIRDGKIRAFYGHSTLAKMEHEEAVPPDILYHGTTPQALQAIRSSGLKPMKRQFVHLSADIETARQVALRRTNRPVILKISASEAYRHGIKFYLGNEMIWLAEPIPPKFIMDDAGREVL